MLVAAQLALARDWPWMGLRCLLALPLAWGVYAGLNEVAWAFSLPTDGLSASLVNVAIGLVPLRALTVWFWLVRSDAASGNGVDLTRPTAGAVESDRSPRGLRAVRSSQLPEA
jgi:hypothetical protein